LRNQVKFVSHTTEPASLLSLYYHPLYNIADRFGGLRAGLEYYRAFPIDANENKVSLVKEGKLQMPVLALAGDFYPAVGGHSWQLCIILNTTISCKCTGHHSSTFKVIGFKKSGQAL
jgi:hypothetical protein